MASFFKVLTSHPRIAALPEKTQISLSHKLLAMERPDPVERLQACLNEITRRERKLGPIEALAPWLAKVYESIVMPRNTTAPPEVAPEQIKELTKVARQIGKPLGRITPGMSIRQIEARHMQLCAQLCQVAREEVEAEAEEDVTAPHDMVPDPEDASDTDRPPPAQPEASP